MVSTHSTDGRRPSTGRVSQAATTKSRLRLIVIQALVFSLFATLFVRLYYLQVVGGEEYHAQAASQSVREIVVQPQRGLIVDDMGRPLVANRTSWVVSVDRNMLDKMPGNQRDRLHRAPGDRSIGQKPGRIRKRLITCGDAGSVVGTCWNGSPYQPVPVATDVRQAEALRILEQPEDYPSVLAEQQSVRAYPQPYGVNLAHVLGYLSPITEDEFDQAKEDGDRSVNGASVRRAAPASRRSTTPGCAGCPATSGWPSTPWAGCSATTARSRASPATRSSPPSTPRSRAWWRSSSPRRSSWRARPATRSPAATTWPTRAPWS